VGREDVEVIEAADAAVMEQYLHGRHRERAVEEIGAEEQVDPVEDAERRVGLLVVGGEGSDATHGDGRAERAVRLVLPPEEGWEEIVDAAAVGDFGAALELVEEAVDPLLGLKWAEAREGHELGHGDDALVRLGESDEGLLLDSVPAGVGIAVAEDEGIDGLVKRPALAPAARAGGPLLGRQEELGVKPDP